MDLLRNDAIYLLVAAIIIFATYHLENTTPMQLFHKVWLQQMRVCDEVIINM